MKLGPQVVDTEAMNALNEIYKVVTKSGTTRLKTGTMLASLLHYEEERDPKQRQKVEAVIEEMTSVSLSHTVTPLLCILAMRPRVYTSNVNVPFIRKFYLLD